jgi:pyruvate/2-oxoglutarate dehydrogenase complex dihydrolipoamide acyltransferase (E2) component
MEVIIERESANDAEAVVVAVLCQSGTTVKKGQRILDVETSKAVQEIYAPVQGILFHSLKVGDTVKLGLAIAHVTQETTPRESKPTTIKHIEAPNQTLSNATFADPSSQTHVGARLSRDAAALAAQHGLTAADFAAEFITSADVRRHLSPGASPASTAAPIQVAHIKPAVGGPAREVRELPPHKRQELKSLGRGAGGSMLSVVGTSLGKQLPERKGDGFFDGKIVDLVIYEASRLMKAFPRLNAAYQDGMIELYHDVNAGIAFDGADRLVVYGIEASDQLKLEQIQDEISEALLRYIENKLTVRELTRATFTITDLSGMEIEFMLPLLPEGQSCIIGITKSQERGYGLYAGFDHRVTEGMEASRFLQDLRQRLIAALGVGT